MSVSLSVSISDNATPAIAAKLAKCDPSRLRKLLAPGLLSFTKLHLRANGTNKRGWPSTGFWTNAARATSWQNVDTRGQSVSGMITINAIGVRQRYHGGVIAPVRAKALAIPISPVSYGHPTKDFPGLFLIKTKKGAYLAQRDASATGKESKTHFNDRAKGMKGNVSRRHRATLTFLFKLVGSVTQQPDPSCIPSGDQLAEVGMAIIEREIK